MTTIRAIHTTLVALFLLFGTAGCWRSANTADDTDTADTETVDTETVDTETADTETADTETTDTETADTETVDTETVDTETTDTETADTETTDTETADSETADTETADTDTLPVCDPGWYLMADLATCTHEFTAQKLAFQYLDDAFRWCTCGLGFDQRIRCWGINWNCDPPEGTFVDITGDEDGLCARRDDGSAVCWGDDAAVVPETEPCHLLADYTVACDGPAHTDMNEPPGGLFLPGQIASGELITAIGQDGLFHLWDDEDGVGDLAHFWSPYADYARTYPFDDVYASAAAGESHVCGATTTGRIVCAGSYGIDPPSGVIAHVENLQQLDACGPFTRLRTPEVVHVLNGEESPSTYAGLGADLPPTGVFARIAVGEWNGYALTADGTPTAWGDNSFGQAQPPSGPFTKIAAGSRHACGLTAGGDVACWGNVASSTRDGSWTDMDFRLDNECLIRSDGSVVCTSYDGYYVFTLGTTGLGDPDGNFSIIATGDRHACGINTDGELFCSDSDQPVAGTWLDVDCGKGTICALSAARTMSCRTYDDGSETWSAWFVTEASEGVFIDVYAEEGIACGLRDDHLIACQGTSDLVGLIPVDVPFADLAIGPAGTACGLRMDDTVTCWDQDAIHIPLSEPLQKISGFVGLTEDGTLTYWDPDVTSPALPAGTFTDISTCGPPCGIRADGAIECWGPDAAGYPPMEGEYLQLSTSGDFLCAVATDHSVRCFDLTPASSSPTDPTLHIPDGAFASVSVNHNQACGVRMDGTLACWGGRLR